MLNIVNKKRKVSKKTKKSWRKHIDTKDVDSFLENERLEERLGVPLSLKKDEDLFTIDNKRNESSCTVINHLSKQQRRELLKKTEPKCFAILKPHTAVPDPISKRNRVRTLEERKSSIRKDIEIKRKLKGQLKLKERVAIQNKLLAAKKRANKYKRGQYNSDVWEEEPTVEPELKSGWITNDTIRHTLSNTGKKQKRVPKSVQKRISNIPAITVPHAGTSYNPSFSDHQELLAKVAADEIKFLKNEEHLNRVTNKMFRKVTLKEKRDETLKEMSEGLPHCKNNSIDSESEDNDSTVQSVNPPTKNEKKTSVQRRKQKEQQKIEEQRLKRKIEKKKVADIYHLNHIQKQISKTQKKRQLLKEKRLKKKLKEELEPNTLSRHKFEPLEPEFQISEELSGNLRNTQPAGNLLKDRYKSLQQRSIVAPGTLVLKKNKAKLKRYIKNDHKIDLKKIEKQ